MEYILRERHLDASSVLIRDTAAIEDRAARRIVLVKQRAAKSGRAERKSADRPIAQIEIVDRLLDEIAAGFRDIEIPVTRSSIVRQIGSRVTLRLHHDDLAD